MASEPCWNFSCIQCKLNLHGSARTYELAVKPKLNSNLKAYLQRSLDKKETLFNE